jgi:galactose mutarotase-like enzyme
MAGSGASVAKSENVLIRAGECTVTVLPQFGGKIASIRIGEQELLQQPLAPIATRTRTLAFDAGDASGWDECLPSVATCSVETEAGVSEIPDHGDLWRVEWEEQGVENREQGLENRKLADASVTLIGKCFSLPLELERRLELVQVGQCWHLKLHYKLTNTSSDAVPWSWSAHPLFAAEEGDRIVLPESIKSLRLEGSGGERLGKGGETVAWPMAKLANGSCVDLSVAEAPDSRVGDKLFTGPLTASENWCELVRPSAGVRIRVTFDAAATPYLGLWFCYGGWPEKPGPKQVCVALEPATAPVDSLAVTGPWSRMLASDESFSWTMEVEIEKER